MDLRGAVVEDLNLPPPLFVCEETSVADARDVFVESFPPPRYLPVISAESRSTDILGYISIEHVENETDDSKPVKSLFVRAKLPKVTLSTPIEEVIAALKQSVLLEVWDDNMKTLLSSVSSFDIERRFPHALH